MEGNCLQNLHKINCLVYSSLLFFYRVRGKSCRGIAQPGSAPAWGAGGRRFKSYCPDHLIPVLLLLITALIFLVLLGIEPIFVRFPVGV